MISTMVFNYFNVVNYVDNSRYWQSNHQETTNFRTPPCSVFISSRKNTGTYKLTFLLLKD